MQSLNTLHPFYQVQQTTPNAQIKPYNLLVRHAGLQVVILAERILEAVLAPLHMLTLVSTQPLNRDVDQAVGAGTWVIAGTLPPHGTTKTSILDVVDLLTRDLRRVVGDHGAGCWVVGPRCDGLRVVEDLGASFGKSLGSLVSRCSGTGNIDVSDSFMSAGRLRLDQVKCAHSLCIACSK